MELNLKIYEKPHKYIETGTVNATVIKIYKYKESQYGDKSAWYKVILLGADGYHYFFNIDEDVNKTSSRFVPFLNIGTTFKNLMTFITHYGSTPGLCRIAGYSELNILK